MASNAQVTVATAPVSNDSLPKGWRMVRFDEFALMVNERVDPSDTEADIYVGLEHLDSDTLKIRRWGMPSDVIGDKLRFRKGDIIFGRRRAYQRKLAVAEFDGICSAHAMVVRAKAETVAAKFLPFLMRSDLFMQRAIDISVGSLSPTINWKTLRIQEFPLPPKDEQHRIADILWAADEVVERFRHTQEKLHVSISVVYQQLFPEVIKTAAEDHEDSAFSKEWTVKSFEHVCEFITSGSRGWAEYYSTEGPIFIRSQNVRNQVLDFSDLQRVAPPQGTEGQRTRVRAGDVLITITGNSVGNVAFVPPDLPEAYVSQHVGLARLIDPDLHRVITAFFSPSGPGNSQILDAQYGQSKPGLSLLA